MHYPSLKAVKIWADLTGNCPRSLVTDTQPTLNHDHWSTPNIVMPTSENKLIYRNKLFQHMYKKTLIETTTKTML